MTEAGDLSAQIREMKELLQLQLQLQQAQTDAAGATASSGPSTPVNAPAKMNQVKVPQGHYEMNRGELRTYMKDCKDYKKLTKYTDAEIVLQLHLHMDQNLKRAIDVNYGNNWDNKTLSCFG